MPFHDGDALSSKLAASDLFCRQATLHMLGVGCVPFISRYCARLEVAGIGARLGFWYIAIPRNW